MTAIKLPYGIYYYDPTQPLGRRGGFGQVFAGRTSQEEQIAVKKLHLSAADAAHRELRIAEELRGRSFEHVVDFLDAGEDAESGALFVIMPRAEKSLQKLLETEGPLDAVMASRIMLEISKGLAEVGDLVHRDLKPDNILLHNSAWKIADFGIARFVAEATSNNTLRDFMSDGYAAPEQWRSERATHATDVYALGCIGFCLLMGSPPFTTDAAQQHQQSPVPPFECADPRLRSLIMLMLRKLQETRPALSRVHDLLMEICGKPCSASDGSSISLLAAVGADIATREQAAEAQAEAGRKNRADRERLACFANEVLFENLERLWGKIHASAPNARREASSNDQFQCSLGQASLSVLGPVPRVIYPPGLFTKSGWDIITAIYIQVIHELPSPWLVFLYYAKPPQASEYRWYEVFYSRSGGGGPGEPGPFAKPSLEEADRALRLGNKPLIVVRGKEDLVRVAHGPVAIDDEMEADFHERWMWVLAKAVKCELGFPKSIPFPWPSELLR